MIILKAVLLFSFITCLFAVFTNDLLLLVITLPVTLILALLHFSISLKG